MAELRWTRSSNPDQDFEAVTLRDVVATLEAYEPARTITAQALTSANINLSTRQLRDEYARLTASPVVLNRRLREVVLETVARKELSMSEIAMRCGRIKRDRRGKEAGETSCWPDASGWRQRAGAALRPRGCTATCSA
jgi:hypothetical protein